MWNNFTFVAELLGTFVLVFGVIATVKSSKRFEGTTKSIFTALGVGTSLMLAVYVGSMSFGGFTGHTFGFVNPAVAVMHAAGNATADHLLPSLAGEFLGGLLAAVIGWTLWTVLAGDTDEAAADVELDVKNSIVGEIIGSAIFLGGVAIAVFYGGSGNLYGFIVGASVALALATAGNKFGLVLNPAAGISMFVFDALESKAFKVNSMLNFLMGAATNVAVGAAIGGTVYGLSQM